MMTSAFAWIGQLVEWFGQFFPRWIVVRSTHGWVKWVRGSKVKVGGSGVVWYWPATTDLVVYPTVRQTIPLPSQIVTTTDQKTIAIAGMLAYEVFDIERLVAHTYDADDTIKDVAAASMLDVLSKLTWDEIRRGQGRRGRLDTELRNAAKKELEDYGVRVVSFTLTTLAPCRVQRFIMSSYQEGEVK